MLCKLLAPDHFLTYLRSMKISIIGCGWLGLPLAESLVSEGHQVKGSTTSPEKLNKLKAKGISPYLVELSPELSGNEGDFFASEILLINIPPKNQDQDDRYHEKQLKSLLQAAINNEIEKIIFISSTSVYPNNNQIVTEKDASYDALSRAGISLLKMEEVFTESEIPTTVLRMGGLYGPGRNPATFFRNRQPKGGNAPVNMVHQEDGIRVISQIISRGLWGQTFNVAAPGKMNKKAFYQKMANQSGESVPDFDMEPIPYKNVSSQKLIKTVNFQFKHTH